MVDWYIWHWWYSRTIGSRHLGVIIKVNLINWHMCFKQDNFGYIIDMDDFAFVYTPTSIEVGEGVTAKLTSVDIASLIISSICLTTSQLVVELHSYGVLLVV